MIDAGYRHMRLPMRPRAEVNCVACSQHYIDRQIPMTMCSHLGQRHQSLRHRGSLSNTAKPRQRVFGIDVLAYIVSILSLLVTVDQVRIIWVEHNSSGVSFLSWGFYAISAFVWFIYGLIHKDKVIVTTNFLWFVFSLLVVIGVVVYS